VPPSETIPGQLPEQLSEFDAPLGWIGDAFDMKKGRLPRLLATTKITPVADLLQHGWGFGIPVTFSIVCPQNTTGFFFSLFGQKTTGGGVPNVTFTWQRPPGIPIEKVKALFLSTMARVIGFDVDHLGGAAAGLVRVRWSFGRGGDPSASPFPRLTQFSVPQASSGDHRQFFGDLATWVPPGWDWIIEVPTTGAGETYVFHIATVLLPGGVSIMS
jgi:hypothetical protein